jgi:AcrR family transcriptional regulator
MEQIARRAGASTKTLYARYSDKAAVVDAVVNRIIKQALEAHAMATSIDPRQVEPRIFIVGLATRILVQISGEGAGLINIALSEARRFPIITKMYNGHAGAGAGHLPQCAGDLAPGRASARSGRSGNGGHAADQHDDRHGAHPHRDGRSHEQGGD